MAAYYNEIEPFAAAWLRELIKRELIAPGDVDERSIADVQPDDVRGYTQCHFFAGIGVWSYALFNAGWADTDPVWTGSCPCQPFSPAGKGEGFSDPRHLWPHFYRLIRECRPDICFGEQTSSAPGRAWLDLVCADLEGIGYAVGASDFPAASVGAPHGRHRLYWVAQPERDGQGRSSAGVVADSDIAVREYSDGGRSVARPDRRDDAGRRSIDGVLADATGGDPEHGDVQPGGQHGLRAQDRRGDGSALEQERTEGPVGVADSEREASVGGVPRGPGSEREGSFWSAADWIACRDGRLRPVEPGTFPLAHGAPARVVRLRGYGNALVAPQAQAFIEAYLDVCEGR